jgi:tRNA/rRNA methyltransferase
LAGKIPDDQRRAGAADVLTGVPMVADYPSLNLGQAVMVYCYQLASLMQTPAVSASVDENQLQALRLRTLDLLTRLGVAGRQTGRLAAAANWALEQRDTAMLHRLLHDIEKTFQKILL